MVLLEVSSGFDVNNVGVISVLAITTNQEIVAKKALCILWYVVGEGSYRMIGKLLQIKHTLVYRWMCEFSKHLPESQFLGDVK